MKKIVCLISLILIILLSACDSSLSYYVEEQNADDIPTYNHIENIVPETTDIENTDKSLDFKTLVDRPVRCSEYYDSFTSKAGYESLKDEYLINLYKKIETAMYSISSYDDAKGRHMIPKLRVRDCKLSEAQITIVMQAISIDYPQVFWINNVFSYTFEDDDTLVQLYSLGDYRDIQTKINKLSGRASEIINSIPGGLNEFEREKLINNYIINYCTYDEDAISMADGWESFTSYGAIVEGKAICGGYSYGTQYLLNLLGINAVSVTGKGKDELHMWNQVKIDGLWYNLDTTWNDNGEMTGYDYFNLDDETLFKSHTASEVYNGNNDSPEDMLKNLYNVVYYECTSMDANYYYKECAIIKELNDEKGVEIISRLADTAMKGEEYFNISIEKETNFENTVNNLFYQSPYKFFYYITEANKLCSNKLNETEITVLKKEHINVITVRLKYN